jgi:beta-glucosidase
LQGYCKQVAKSPARVGFAPVGGAVIPAAERPEDVDAARRMMFSVSDRSVWNNTWWMDPVLLGTYPEDGLRLFGEAAPQIQPGARRSGHDLPALRFLRLQQLSGNCDSG